MVVKLSEIIKYFEDELSLVKKGEDAVTSNHVISVTYDGEISYLRGQIQASMKNKSYSVQVHLSPSGAVIETKCACPRGQFKCHHVAALMIYANENISSTSRSCTWNIKRKTANDQTTCHRVENMFPVRKQFRATSCPVKAEDREQFHVLLNKSHYSLGFTWLLSPEPDVSSAMEELLLMEKLLFCKEYRAASDKMHSIKEKARIIENEVKRVATITVGQVNNPLWFLVRKYRLTASNFGKVIACCKRNKFPPSLFKRLKGDIDLQKVRSIQWGRDNEKTAIRQFEEENGVEVTATGVWLHTSGLLAASPDGLIPSENAVVEVKCPYSFRSTDSLKETLKRDKSYVVFLNDTDQFVWNTEHEYYHQIQGQMHITGADKCYLIIWVPSGSIACLAVKEPNWESNLDILQHFYLNKYLKELE